MTHPRLVDQELSKKHHEFIQTENAVEKVCYKCGKIIRVGQKLHSSPSRTKGHSKHYHQECWNIMFK